MRHPFPHAKLVGRLRKRDVVGKLVRGGLISSEYAPLKQARDYFFLVFVGNEGQDHLMRSVEMIDCLCRLHSSYDIISVVICMDTGNSIDGNSIIKDFPLLHTLVVDCSNDFVLPSAFSVLIRRKMKESSIKATLVSSVFLIADGLVVHAQRAPVKVQCMPSQLDKFLEYLPPSPVSLTVSEDIVT